MKNWGTERLRIFSKATKLLSGRPGIRALALQHIWFCPEQLLETCGQHEKVLFKTSLETSDPHLKVCDIWSCPKMSQTSHIVQWDIWSMPKGPWYLVLFHNVNRDIWAMPKVPWSVRQLKSRGMDKLSSRFLKVTFKYGHQCHDKNDRIKSILLTLFIDRMNRKPKIRLIYTWEQLLINCRVPMSNFILQKNKKSKWNPRFLMNYKKNNSHTVWTRFSVWVLQIIIDQMSLWMFWIRPNIKNLLAWTEWLQGAFGQDHMSANRAQAA